MARAIGVVILLFGLITTVTAQTTMEVITDPAEIDRILEELKKSGRLTLQKTGGGGSGGSAQVNNECLFAGKRYTSRLLKKSV